MSMLLQYFGQNQNLRFIDAKNNAQYSLNDLLIKLPWLSDTKKLIFLYLNSSIESLSIYLSFLNTDHTLALLNEQLDADLKKGLEELYRPHVVYDSSRDFLNSYTTHSLSFTGQIFIKSKPNVKAIINEKCKVLLSTSGTTGSPKFVKLSGSNLLENAKSIASYLPIVQEDVTPLNLPLYYSYGLSVLHSNMIAGGTIVCGLPDILQREFWGLFTKYNCTSLAGVPFVYEMLKRIGFLKKEYSHLRYITQAGGNLNEKIKSLFLSYCEDHKIQLFIMYGQTEATARISYVPFDRLKEKITSIGIPIPNGVLSLDPETSELLYKGPNVFGGYAKEEKDLEFWNNDTTLKTGDIAKTDDDGYFYIVGRMKRFVKLFGNRVNLDEIENFLKSMFGSGLTCSGVQDKVLLISYTDSSIDEDLVKKSIFEKFKIHPKSVRFQMVQEFPLTSNGKINYKKLTSGYDL